MQNTTRKNELANSQVIWRKIRDFIVFLFSFCCIWTFWKKFPNICWACSRFERSNVFLASIFADHTEHYNNDHSKCIYEAKKSGRFNFMTAVLRNFHPNDLVCAFSAQSPHRAENDYSKYGTHTHTEGWLCHDNSHILQAITKTLPAFLLCILFFRLFRVCIRLLRENMSSGLMCNACSTLLFSFFH